MVFFNIAMMKQPNCNFGSILGMKMYGPSHHGQLKILKPSFS